MEDLKTLILQAIISLENEEGHSLEEIEWRLPRTVSRDEIRRTIWEMVSDCQLDFTPTWRVERVKMENKNES